MQRLHTKIEKKYGIDAKRNLDRIIMKLNKKTDFDKYIRKIIELSKKEKVLLLFPLRSAIAQYFFLKGVFAGKSNIFLQPIPAYRVKSNNPVLKKIDSIQDRIARRYQKKGVSKVFVIDLVATGESFRRIASKFPMKTESIDADLSRFNIFGKNKRYPALETAYRKKAGAVSPKEDSRKKIIEYERSKNFRNTAKLLYDLGRLYATKL